VMLKLEVVDAAPMAVPETAPIADPALVGI
jgi:hypothetical protein